jgi:hypothetical protein
VVPTNKKGVTIKNSQLTINERVKNLEHDITLTKEAIQQL